MRRIRRLLTLILSAAGASCSDGVAPEISEIPLLFSLQAPAAVSPAELEAVADAFDLVDRYHVLVADSLTGSTLINDTMTVSTGGSGHVLDLTLPPTTVGLSARVTIAGLDGTREMYRASGYARIQDGATATPVALQVRYTGPGVRGTLQDAAAAPLEDVTILLMQGNNLVQSVTTEDDGTYLFLGVPAGLYQVVPSVSGNQFVCPSVRNVTVSGPSASILADFQTSATPCVTDLLIVSGGDLAFSSDTAFVSAMFAQIPSIRRATFFFVNAPPSLDYLKQFDVVLLFANGLFAQSPTLGNRIEEYVRLGGNVITATFYWQNRSDSSLGATGWGKLEVLDPFSHGTGQTYQAAALDSAATVAHPLTSGLTFLTSTGFRGAVAAKQGTTVVARWNDGSPLIGYRVLPWGSRMVGVSLFPASGVAAAGNFTTVWANAVSWAGEAGGPIS